MRHNHFTQRFIILIFSLRLEGNTVAVIDDPDTVLDDVKIPVEN